MSGADGSDRPNVVLVMADQFRGIALENPAVETPTLEAFGRRNATFQRAYSPNPSCGPARGSVMTGLYPHSHRVIDNNLRLPDRVPTLAERLDGYDTGYVGKWHLDGEPAPGYIPPERRRGFEFWEGFNRDHSHNRGHPRFDDGELYWEAGYQPAVQTDLAAEFLEGADEPFFLTLAWGPPHGPYDAPEEYSDRYDPEALGLRPNVPPEMDTPERREKLAQYYAMMTAIDDQFEGLLAALEEAGVREETAVVFTADHGDMHGSQGRTRKYVPFEESIRVPLLADVPDGPALDVETPVSLVDIAPTVCGLAGVDIDAHGRDLSGLLGGTATPAEAVGDRTGVYAEGMLPYDREAWRALRTPEAMLAVDSGLTVRYHYDTDADPYQRENLAGEPAHADREADLRAALIEAANRYDDRRVVSVAGMLEGGVETPLAPRGDVFPE